MRSYKTAQNHFGPKCTQITSFENESSHVATATVPLGRNVTYPNRWFFRECLGSDCRTHNESLPRFRLMGTRRRSADSHTKAPCNCRAVHPTCPCCDITASVVCRNRPRVFQLAPNRVLAQEMGRQKMALKRPGRTRDSRDSGHSFPLPSMQHR